MMRSKNPERLNAVFKTLEAAAVAGRRCPENGQHGVTSDIVVALAHAGRITIEISNKNWRRVVILEGEHAGKATAGDPNGCKPWQVIGTETTVNGKTKDFGASQRREPSKPRPLTAADLAKLFGGAR